MITIIVHHAPRLSDEFVDSELADIIDWAEVQDEDELPTAYLVRPIKRPAIKRQRRARMTIVLE